MKRAAAFRECPPSVLGYVRGFLSESELYFLRWGKRGESGEKVIFVGKVKTLGKKNV